MRYKKLLVRFAIGAAAACMLPVHSGSSAPSAFQSIYAAESYLPGIYSVERMLAVRTEAGEENASLLGFFKSGTEVTVTSICMDPISGEAWGRVLYDYIPAWISLDGCKLVRQIKNTSSFTGVTTLTRSLPDRNAAKTGAEVSEVENTVTEKSDDTESVVISTHIYESFIHSEDNTEEEADDSPVEESKGDLYVITADVLNVHSGMGSGTSVLGGVERDQIVLVLGTEVQEGTNWGEIEFEGSTGYIAMKFCEPADSNAVYEPSASDNSQVTRRIESTGTEADDSDTSVIKVRSGPAGSYAIIGSITDTENLAFSKVVNGWGCFSFNGKDGWIPLK